VQTIVSNEQRVDRRYTISGVGVGIRAPLDVLRVLDVTLLHVPRSEAECTIVLSVTKDDERWRISDEYGPIIALPKFVPIPEVTGALTTAMVEGVGRSTKDVIVTATIVAKNDFAVALVGHDWESCVAIAAHLSLRGWSFVTPRHAFVDPDTRAVEPFAKLLYIPARIIPLLPLQYRRALEASPWYSTGADLGFYGVDLLSVPGVTVGPERPILRAGIIVDPSRREHNGAVYEPSHTYIGGFLPFLGVGIASASLVVGSVVPTTDAVERWFSTLTIAH
jgi:hypothetical protein